MSYLKKKNKNVYPDLKESLLEGGGLTAGALKMLDSVNDEINKSLKGHGSKSKMTKSSDQTHIEGLKQFSEHQQLFRDLTIRKFVDTTYDVVSMIITQNSRYCVAIVTRDEEYF